jgi:hypothetical protein
VAKQYYLVTGTSASQIERLTGLRAIDTDLGTLVERPPEPKPYIYNPISSFGGIHLLRSGGVINGAERREAIIAALVDGCLIVLRTKAGVKAGGGDGQGDGQ